MSFLGKVGNVFKIALTGLRQANPVLEMVGKAIPGPDPLEQVSAAITAAEAIGEIVKQQGGTKLDKFPLVLEQATAIFKQTELVAHREIADEDKFGLGVRQVVQGIYNIKDSLKPVG